MATQVTIKRSPIVLFRTFALIEIAAFVAYLLAVGHGNVKYDFYNGLFLLPDLLSYQAAKYLLLSGAQFVITIYAFFRWYYEVYTISSGKLLHKWGVFFKKEKTIPLEKSATVTLASGPLGKMFHYGSIHIDSGGGHRIVLADISHPELHLRAIEKLRQPARHFEDDSVDIAALIEMDEHEQLEFKSSLRVDRKQGGVSREIEKSAMKTIAAFMNSHGGNLILGVSDAILNGAREIIGLEGDYASLPRANSDGFENHFTQLFNRMLGPENRNLVQLQFQSVGGRDVCLVRVAKSARPVYLKMDDTEYFYVRTGNATTPLKLSEVASYSRVRWPRRVS